jgi:nitric oxide reductase activation protein
MIPFRRLSLRLRMMPDSLSNPAATLSKALIVISLIATPLSFAAGQSVVRKQRPPAEQTKPEDDKEEPLTVVEEEMRAKRAIKEADREYQENLDRARDLSSLGSAIVTSFKQKNGLDPDDIKKLDKVEKLAKGIRRAAGGSEDKVEMEQPPKDLTSAMEMLSDLSQSLKEKVEKTPKHVISACVIDEANVLLELIRVLRTLPAKV